MNTCTIILPIDKRRSMQLLVLLQMFGSNAVIPVKEITKVIPKSTFFALLYKLRLMGKIVKDRFGFDLFLFEKMLDLDSRKQAKAMKLNAAIDITELEGNSFVIFSKALQGK